VAFVAALGRSWPPLKLLDLSSNDCWRVDVSSALSNSSGTSGGHLLQLQALIARGTTLTRPTVLCALTRLTSLSLGDATVHSPDRLLTALPQLLQLQDLDLRHLHYRGWPTAEQPFTVTQLRDALAPLTNLTALRLSNTKYVDDPAAVELQLITQRWLGLGQRPAIKGLFPGLFLPRLQVLDASDLCWNDTWRKHRPLCGTGDLHDLTAALPSICSLHIGGSMAWTSSTCLDIEHFRALAGSLTRLDMSAEGALQDEQLQSFTALRALASLTVAQVGPHITDRGILGPYQDGPYCLL
jgi:hypothetical protein